MGYLSKKTLAFKVPVVFLNRYYISRFFSFSLWQNGKWNGLMGELMSKKFDMVLTSLKVNAEREAAVDFTSPFLESGTTILVAKRTGIISPTAFLGKSWALAKLQQCGSYGNLPSHFFDKKNRESNVFTKELIWRNIFLVRLNFSFFHTVEISEFHWHGFFAKIPSN